VDLKPRTDPLPIGEQNVVVLIFAFGTEFGHGNDLSMDEVLAVPQGFVFHLTRQISECGIQPRFRVLAFYASAFRLKRLYNMGERKANT
jgi:hypothetical protein